MTWRDTEQRKKAAARGVQRKKKHEKHRKTFCTLVSDTELRERKACSPFNQYTKSVQCGRQRLFGGDQWINLFQSLNLEPNSNFTSCVEWTEKNAAPRGLRNCLFAISRLNLIDDEKIDTTRARINDWVLMSNALKRLVDDYNILRGTFLSLLGNQYGCLRWKQSSMLAVCLPFPPLDCNLI